MRGAIAEIASGEEAGAASRLQPLNLQPVVRAMSQFGGGAIASGLLSAAATKIIAATLGPPGVALLGTLQQWRETALVGATLSGQTALVQGASGLTNTARREFIRTSLGLFGLGTVLVALVLLLAPEQAARLSGLGSARTPLLRWLVAPVVLGAAYVFLNGVLNALGDVRALAGLQLVAPAVLALLAYPVAVGVSRGVERLLPVLLATSSAAAVAAVVAALARHGLEFRSWFAGPGRWWTRPAARHFFALSGSMLVSGLAANGALAVVRAQILRAQGLAVTGQFDASWAIVLNLSTLLLGSVQAYYLPLLARARTPEERSAHIAAVFRVAVPAAAVILVGLAALKPLVLRCLYSGDFDPAAAFLRWTLIGNYLKITSWILSVPMLACADAKVFLAAELAAWGTFCAGTLALQNRWPPAPSAAMSFVLMYSVHLAISSAYVRRRGLHWGGVGPVWLVGLGLVLAASAAHWNQPVGPAPVGPAKTGRAVVAPAGVGPVVIQTCAAGAWMGLALGSVALALRKGRTECAR